VASNQKQTTTSGWQATPNNCPVGSDGRTANIGDCGETETETRMWGYGGNYGRRDNEVEVTKRRCE